MPTSSERLHEVNIEVKLQVLYILHNLQQDGNGEPVVRALEAKLPSKSSVKSPIKIPECRFNKLFYLSSLKPRSMNKSFISITFSLSRLLLCGAAAGHNTVKGLVRHYADLAAGRFRSTPPMAVNFKKLLDLSDTIKPIRPWHPQQLGR